MSAPAAHLSRRRRLPPTLSVRDMRNELLARAHGAGLACGTPSRWTSSRHGRFAAGGSCVAPVRFSGGHRSGGLQRHIASARSLVRGGVARKRHPFTGGPSRGFGWSVQRAVASANAKYGCRVLGSIAAARRRLAINLGLALARAASDNKSMHTDVQVLPAAARPRLTGAGDLRR